MMTSNTVSSDNHSTAEATNQCQRHASPADRVSRLYTSPGGPFIAWLFDECRRRREDYKDMAAHLGVTYGYINQLRSGLRRTEHISDDVAQSAARYLGVPTIVVKLVAGRISASDFMPADENEEAATDRAYARMLDDPAARQAIPTDVGDLPLKAKQALVMMYSEASGNDVLGLRQLPEMLRWLKSAADVHDASCEQAIFGQHVEARQA